jgi:hypothetical protein
MKYAIITLPGKTEKHFVARRKIEQDTSFIIVATVPSFTSAERIRDALNRGDELNSELLSRNQTITAAAKRRGEDSYGSGK